MAPMHEIAPGLRRDLPVERVLVSHGAPILSDGKQDLAAALFELQRSSPDAAVAASAVAGSSVESTASSAGASTGSPSYE
jgi:hypothetical protein